MQRDAAFFQTFVQEERKLRWKSLCWKRRVTTYYLYFAINAPIAKRIRNCFSLIYAWRTFQCCHSKELLSFFKWELADVLLSNFLRPGQLLASHSNELKLCRAHRFGLKTCASTAAWRIYTECLSGNYLKLQWILKCQNLFFLFWKQFDIEFFQAKLLASMISELSVSSSFRAYLEGEEANFLSIFNILFAR